MPDSPESPADKGSPFSSVGKAMESIDRSIERIKKDSRRTLDQFATYRTSLFISLGGSMFGAGFGLLHSYRIGLSAFCVCFPAIFLGSVLLFDRAVRKGALKGESDE